MKKTLFRWLIYLAGMLILAVGLTLNTKTGLGVSAILTVPYAVSEIWKLNFGNITLLLYILFVTVQVVLHLTEKTSGAVIVRDVLQLPLSVVFTRIMNATASLVPVLSEAYPGRFLGSVPGRVFVLIAAVCFTGIGASMTLSMRLVPNPSDGIVQTLAERRGKSVGNTKNCFDLCSVLTTLVIGLAFDGSIVGIGIGTLVAALGVGRVMHLFERVCKGKICTLAGLG